MAEAQVVGIVGTKLGMTHVYDENGKRLAVTRIATGGGAVTQVKTGENDGYNAIQVGFGDVSKKRVNKPRAGHFAKAKVPAKRFLREFRVDAASIGSFEAGQEQNVTLIQKDQRIDITGLSKGRGFSGVMRRHNFSGFPATHGTHEYFRHGGSIGCAFPQRVRKGLKMPGQYGQKQITTQNLRVVEVIQESNEILVEGPVPGSKGSTVWLQSSVKAG